MKRVCTAIILLSFLIGIFSLSCSSSSQIPSLQNVPATPQIRKTEYRPYYYLEKKDFSSQRAVEQGVLHRVEWEKSGPLFFNVLTVNMDNSHLRLEVEKGKDQLYEGERVASIAEREDRQPDKTVVAAINGDFWGKKHMPISLFVDDGTIFKGPHPHRSVFLLDDQGIPHIKRVKMEISLNANNQTLPVNDINPLEPKEDALLFNSRYGEKIEFNSPRNIFILKKIGKEFLPNKALEILVTDVLSGITNHDLHTGTLILAVKPESSLPYQKALRKNSRAILNAKLDGFDKPVVLAIGGTPRLIRDGNISIEYEQEKIRESFSTTRHPRTALGISRDRKTVFLVTVDGRQPKHSIGIDLENLAAYLKDLGAWDALNLDGGGSTTMWVRYQITNRPSDASGPRICSNSLLVTSSALPGAPASLDLHHENLVLAPGVTMNFEPDVFDAHYNPLDIPAHALKWELSGNIGVIDQADFHADTNEGKGSITVSLPGTPLSDTVSVEIAKPEKILVSPKVVMMSTNESLKIDISALSHNGEYLYILPHMIQTNVPSSLEWMPQLGSIVGKKPGKHRICFMIGGTKTQIPVYVDHFRKEVVEGFENPEDVTLTMTLSDKDTTHLARENSAKKEGNSSLRLTYNLLHGGTSAVYLTINRTIPGQPYKLGFWVYGDGREQWLRGIISDKDGEDFIADFTNGTRGVFWKDEWRYVEVIPSRLNPKWNNPEAKMDYPLNLKQIYLVQTREAKKSAGSILIDGFCALYPKD